MRMGVPKGVVEWFIELDDGGLSFIDTLLYANTYALHSHKDMFNENKHMCGATNIEERSFEAERGIKHGENASSLQWTLLYNMYWNGSTPRIGISIKIRICKNTATKQPDTLHMHKQTT
jgi:hypothetical protein